METVVLDANIGVALIVKLPYSTLAEELVERWQTADARILVPMLWHYEVVSALRKALAANLISNEDVAIGLNALFQLGVQPIEPSLELHRTALTWAARLKQIVVYDAHYLALSEREGAEFWTADQQLARRALDAGASWVRWLQSDSEK
ncbi:MAG TPA: type II toxin-antitoxin system VapC family toxin [Anaerolineae bacterium]|nr:type II toxin-antitoxin system VapC family toxin [Anaerolineae bacterium]